MSKQKLLKKRKREEREEQKNSKKIYLPPRKRFTSLGVSNKEEECSMCKELEYVVFWTNSDYDNDPVVEYYLFCSICSNLFNWYFQSTVVIHQIYRDFNEIRYWKYKGNYVWWDVEEDEKGIYFTPPHNSK